MYNDAMTIAHADNNIKFLGWCDNDKLSEIYGMCKALIFPGIEDFGIVPLEAMASGKPVIAFGKGGVLETVVAGGENPTGVFFYEQTSDDLIAALEISEKKNYNPLMIREHALAFDHNLFKSRIKSYIEDKVSRHFG